jgi:hypothetical protein
MLFELLPCALAGRHANEACWGVEVWIRAFFDLGIGCGGCSASRPGRYVPRERALGTHWIGGWVGPRAVRILT